MSERLKSEISQYFAATINYLRDETIYGLKLIIRLFQKTDACGHSENLAQFLRQSALRNVLYFIQAYTGCFTTLGHNCGR